MSPCAIQLFNQLIPVPGEFGSSAVHGFADAASERIVRVGRAQTRPTGADEPVFRIEGVGIRSVIRQVPIGIVAVGRSSHGAVLVQIVGHVGAAIYQGPVPHGIVLVAVRLAAADSGQL